MKTKKKHKKHGYRNAAPRSAPARNAAPRAPRGKSEPETAMTRLGYTAAGAAGTALVGSFLAREGWAPKTVATALAAVGAGLAWKGDESTIRSLGAGAMSAAGSQLALMLMESKAEAKPATPEPEKKPANAGELPSGSLENAFERAKSRLAIASDE